MYGVDIDSLAPIRTADNPVIVAGRVLQYDADIGAYNATFDEEMAFDDCVHNFLVQAETYRLMAGAERIILHLTANGSTKAGRYDYAIQQQYQGNRNDKVPPKFLRQLREYLAGTFTSPDEEVYAINWADREADDGMVQYQHASDTDLSVICSDDKDLRMASGWHLDWREYDLRLVNGFGSCYLDDSTSTKKVKGYGTSFFWHQLLMGDTADAIKGLAYIHPSIMLRIKPTKAQLKALADDKEPKLGNPRPCGAVFAYELLKDCKTDLECLAVVAECYRKCYGDEWYSEFLDRKFSWKEVLHNEGKLLWMQRKQDEDWFDWIKELKDDS